MILKEFEFFHSTLQEKINVIEFAHALSLVSGHNDNVLKQKSTIQQKQFNNLLKDKKPQYDPKKIIFNYSSYVLSEAEKYLLQKGSNFNIRPKNLIILINLSILNIL